MPLPFPHRLHTEKIAKAMATKLGADIKKAKDINPLDINNYDIIGLGSGVYRGRLHSNLTDIIDNLPYQNDKKSFIFFQQLVHWLIASLHKIG